jgi:hypothetical protein
MAGSAKRVPLVDGGEVARVVRGACGVDVVTRGAGGVDGATREGGDATRGAGNGARRGTLEGGVLGSDSRRESRSGAGMSRQGKTHLRRRRRDER